ncbi:AbrB/MazE/SpoVT family DNA-binding domain-containing protein [Candidatus Pacearchaeota archaeon]|nr:AbrB/MazE/SpoVT family DNA-binding domain-containing protein [Candidatus Pacearchaeota archaeon]
MEITKISSKGQIVIPSKIRTELKINDHSLLALEKVDNVVIIKKIEDELFNKIKKSLEDVKYGRLKEWKK